MVLSAVVLIGCGKEKSEDIKNYQIFIEGVDATTAKQASRLFKEYNRRAGREYLTQVFTLDQANSLIKLDNDLVSSENKLGYGSWQLDTVETDRVQVGIARTKQIKNYYSMNIEFDAGFFLKNVSLDQHSFEWRRLFVLFCHEVGHGLTFDHDLDNKSSVMFPVIGSPDDADLDAYFKRVDQFFDEL